MPLLFVYLIYPRILGLYHSSSEKHLDLVSFDISQFFLTVGMLIIVLWPCFRLISAGLFHLLDVLLGVWQDLLDGVDQRLPHLARHKLAIPRHVKVRRFVQNQFADFLSVWKNYINYIKGSRLITAKPSEASFKLDIFLLSNWYYVITLKSKVFK